MNNENQEVTLHVKADISEVRGQLDKLRSELNNLNSGIASSGYQSQASSGQSLVNTNSQAGTQFNSSIQQLSQIINSLPDKLAHLNDDAHQIKNGGTTNSYAEASRAQTEAHREVYGQRINEAQSVLHQAGYDSQGNRIDSRGDFKSQRNQAGYSYSDLRQQVSKVTRSNAGIGRTVLNASNDHNISYERYNRIGQDYQRNQTSSGYLKQQIDDYQHIYQANAQDYTNRAGVAADAGDTSASKQYTQQAEYFKNLGDKLDHLANTLDKSNAEAEDNYNKVNSGVESGQINQAAPRGSFQDMLQTRSFAIGMNMVNNVQSGISGQYNAGTQARLGMQDSINGMTLGNVGNGGSVTPYADNRLTSRLAHLGINNGTGYSATDMANFAGTYAQSSGNTNATQDVQAAGYTSQLARFSGVGTSNANQLVSALGLAGATPNSRSLGTITRQFQGMLSNTGTSGQAVQQAQALSSLVSNQYNNGNRVSTNDASRLVALQGLSSRYGFSGQQGAQQINNMSNSISSKGFQNSAMRFAWMNTDPQRYAGTIGQAQQALDMNNPLSAKNAGHLSGMIQNIKMTQGHGNDTLTAEYLMQNMGISGQYARQLTKMSDRGQLNPSSLRKLEQQNKRKGSSTNRHQQRQFEAQGNSTLDIQVAVKQNGEISTSESMDSLRRAKNSATGGLPGLANAGLSIGGGIIGNVASVGATGLAYKGLRSLAGRGGTLGRVGKFGSGIMEAGASLFGGGLGKGATKEASEAGEAVKGATRGGGLSRMVSRGKGKLSSLFNFTGKHSEGDGAFLEDTGKLAKFGGKGNIALQAAMSLPEYYQDIKSKHPVKNTVKTTGGLAGGIAGAGYGAAAGSALGPIGTVVGGIGGGIVGSIGGRGIASGITDLFSGKSKKKRRKGSKGSDDAGSTYTHAEDVIKDANKWLHDFNVALNTAQRIVRQAENKSSGNGGKGGGSGSPNKNTTSGGKLPKGSKKKSPTSWSSNIKAAAKQMGVNLKKGDISQIEKVIKGESGGDPKAVNNTAPGTPTGLLQYKAGTFKNYKVKGHSNIKNGNDNLLAMFNDKNWRKDLVTGGWSPTGSVRKHAEGGIFNNPQEGILAEAGPEALVPLSTSKRSQATSIMNTVSGMLGTNLSTAARSTNNNQSYNFAPTNTIEINAKGGGEGNHYTALKQQLAEVQQQVSLQQQRSFLKQRADYYAN